jgi:hypothetical protein
MPRLPTYTESEVRTAVANARSLSDALRALGLRTAGGNFRTLKALIARYDISTEHLDSNWARRATPPVRHRVPLAEVMTTGSTYNRTDLKRRLYDEGLKQRACELCQQGEQWHGRHISLVLDHVNGIHDDNRLENLRIVCPNCNAGLDTHCGRRTRNGPRDCARCGAEFLPRYTNQQYCSQECGSRYPRSRRPKPESRKAERPSYGQLLRELEESNYSAVGRQYGVSDNAVRKWVRAYEYQAQQAAPRSDLSLAEGHAD